MEAARSGEVLDFDDVSRHFTPQLKAALVAQGAEPELADEIAQETLLRAYRYRHTYDPARPLWPWLAKIAFRIHAAIRREERVRVVSLSPAIERELPGVFPNVDPQEVVVARDMNVLDTLPSRYQRVFDTLPLRYQHLLILKYLRKCSYEDIAKLEGMSVVAVHTVLRRARERFRQVVAERGNLGMILVPAALRGLIDRFRGFAIRLQSRFAKWEAACASADTSRVIATLGLSGIIAFGMSGALPVHTNQREVGSRALVASTAERHLPPVDAVAMKASPRDQPHRADADLATSTTRIPVGASATTDRHRDQRFIRREAHRDDGSRYDGDSTIRCESGVVTRTVCALVDPIA